MNVYEEEIVEKWFYTYGYDIEIIDTTAEKVRLEKIMQHFAIFDAIIVFGTKRTDDQREEILKFEEERKESLYSNPNGEAGMEKPAPTKGNFTQRD